MIQNFKIDQQATFGATVFLSCDPKYRFRSTDQECTKDGTPKYEVQVLGAFKDVFGKTNNEVMKVGIAAHGDPAEGMNPYTPIELVDFEVGVMEKTKRDEQGNEKVIGVQVWYRAQGLRPAGAATAPASATSAAKNKSTVEAA